MNSILVSLQCNLRNNLVGECKKITDSINTDFAFPDDAEEIKLTNAQCPKFQICYNSKKTKTNTASGLFNSPNRGIAEPVDKIAHGIHIYDFNMEYSETFMNLHRRKNGITL